MSFFSRWLKFNSQDMAIDLGTANTLVYVKGKGIILMHDLQTSTAQALPELVLLFFFVFPIWKRICNPGNLAGLGLPLIIKPVHEGSSVGMSKVEKAEDLAAAIEKATVHDAVVMAEKWITGREYTISFLNGQPLPVIRLQPPADVAFYDYDAKYNRNDVQYGIPCGLSEAEEKRLQALCLRAFQAVGASGWGRIDAMQDENGNFWLLEVNTVPGMTSHSLVPKAAKAVGLDFDQLCVAILEQTLNGAVH